MEKSWNFKKCPLYYAMDEYIIINSEETLFLSPVT